MQKFVISMTLVLLSQFGWAKDEVVGYWAGPDSILHLTIDGVSLNGHVVSLKDAVYLPEEAPKPAGEPRLDDNNPDEALRSRPLLGLNLFSNYEHTGKRWQGKIYDPESGKTYSSRVSLDKDGNLKMRGYIGTPLLGRTVVFEPLSLCKPHMVELIEMVALDACGVGSGT